VPTAATSVFGMTTEQNTASTKHAAKTSARGKTGRKATAPDTDSGSLSVEERAAMKQRAAELRAAAKRAKGADKAAAEAQDCLDKIADLPDGDRQLAERVHALVTQAAPELAPKTWYGMPAYAKDGNLVCFFQPASKFKARYATFGFEAAANLDDGSMWPTSFAVLELGAAEEKLITELVNKAVS
jgi:uncharacterized protein YdhG (YjbR/CyaY superfamily)